MRSNLNIIPFIFYAFLMFTSQYSILNFSLKCRIHSDFKIACLYYNPSNVFYKNKKYSRQELIKSRWESLKQLGIKVNLNEFPNSPVSWNQRESLTANIMGHKRTYKHFQKVCPKNSYKHDISVGTVDALHNSKTSPMIYLRLLISLIHFRYQWRFAEGACRKVFAQSTE